jgi:hypothetical protein
MLRVFKEGKGVRMAIVIPALTAISLVTADVSSITLSSADVASGGSVTGTVTVSGQSRSTTRVTLASSNPSVATVPSTVFVGRLGRSTFSVNAVKGAAGCSEISARVGSGAVKSALLFVQPPSSSSSGMGISLNPTSAVGGTSVNGRVFVGNPGTNLTVQLSSSHPSVTVPASVQLQAEEVGYAGSFTIQTSVVAPSTCSVITATHGSAKDRKLLKVFTISG